MAKLSREELDALWASIEGLRNPLLISVKTDTLRALIQEARVAQEVREWLDYYRHDGIAPGDVAELRAILDTAGTEE